MCVCVLHFMKSSSNFTLLLVLTFFTHVLNRINVYSHDFFVGRNVKWTMNNTSYFRYIDIDKAQH